MPLPESIRSEFSAVPSLDWDSTPPTLTRGSQPPVTDLSYPAFKFDRKEDKLGEGGNAVVYRATVPAEDLTVALKQPYPKITVENETAKQILSEGEKWATVDDHPYIASILDWGDSGAPWMAIEYLAGHTLQDRYADFDIDQRLWTAYAIVDAVAYASGQHGIPHHDLKPQNILFQQMPDETWDVPKVVDWGLSQKLNQHTGSTSQSTFEYAAPEQYEEIMPEVPVGVHTDVYQLGVVCYELLTGKLPNHLRGDIEPPSQIEPSVPAVVDNPIMGALAHDRQTRITYPVQLKDELKDILADIDTIKSESTGVVENTELRQKSARQRRTIDRRWSTTMYRGGQRRTGRQPDEQPVQGPVDRIWSADTGRVVGAPAIVDDMLLFGAHDNRVHALRTDTGGEKWSMKAGDKFESSPAVACGHLFIGNHDNKVYALDRTNGDVDWTHQTNFWVTSSPAVHDGIVYIGSSDYSVYALEANTGDILWEFPTEGDIGWSSPAVVENLVIVASGDGNLYGVNLNTGAEEWRFVTDFLMHTTPAVANGIAYVGSSQNRLYAIEIDSGELKWTFDTGDDVQSAPAVSDRTVFFGSDDGAVYAVNTTDGTEQWSYPTNRGIAGGVTVVGDTVYAGNDAGTIFALDTESGRPRWRQNLRSAVTAAPVVSDSRLYVGTDDGMVAIGPSQQ